MKDRTVISKLNKHQVRKLVNRIDSINFKGLEDYHVGISLIILLKHLGIKSESYAYFWNTPVYGDTYYLKDKKGKTMFLFSNSYKGRKDFENWFLKISELLKEKIIVLPGKEKREGFLLKEKLQMVLWIFQMKKTKLSLKEKLVCANLLSSGKRNLEKLAGIIEKRKIRSIVTLADVHLIDNLVTVYCNKRGIKTVTLQHGFFPEDDPFFFCSESDYFLTYSEYTKQLALKHKKRRGVFLAVGMPDFIKENKIASRVGETKGRFLVLLNGSPDKERRDNKKMLKICMNYAERKNVFFDVKAHPGDGDLQEYRSLIAKRGKFIASKSNITGLFEGYDFCVANVTTMALKAIYMLVPIVFFLGKGEKSFFGLDKSRLNFSDYLEMEQAVSYIREDDIEDELIKIREFLCGSGDITKNYQEFLEKL